jgi:hypothetical protein
MLSIIRPFEESDDCTSSHGAIVFGLVGMRTADPNKTGQK